MKITTYSRLASFFFAMTLVLSILGCANNPSPTSQPTENSFADLTITLERTVCHGTCPSYKLTIDGDGTVTYEGQEFVQVKGKQIASIGFDQIQELVSVFEAANFFSLQGNYTTQDVTDSPSAITSIAINGRTKTVTHYYGDNSAPQELFDLESKIDEITNSTQWTGK
jgi:hypothetical protein